MSRPLCPHCHVGNWRPVQEQWRHAVAKFYPPHAAENAALFAALPEALHALANPGLRTADQLRAIENFSALGLNAIR